MKNEAKMMSSIVLLCLTNLPKPKEIHFARKLRVYFAEIILQKNDLNDSSVIIIVSGLFSVDQLIN